MPILPELYADASELPAVLGATQRRLRYWWNALLSIGLAPGLSHWDRKRVRLLNGIAGLGLGVLVTYALAFAASPDHVTFWLLVLGVVLNLGTLVLNYSEVSTDLVEDMDDARGGGRTTVLQQISQHGQRATSIIKGMLEHARSGTSPRELTDLNALIQESLDLAYEGLRAQDPAFEARLTVAFDAALPGLPVVAPDLRMVLINLFANGFHAMREQRQTPAAASLFVPELTLTTRAVPGAVEIWVRDNGTGMPDHVREKIFQPFFTTKPVGEGTGLGLSMSFDIVTKGHGGTLAVSSTEGLGTEFVIRLPQA